jgi:hypothetical protein
MLNIANKRTVDELDSTGTYIFLLLNIANKRTADELDAIVFFIVKYSQQENS